MSNRRVVVNLSFDVSFVVDAESDEEANSIAEEMCLSDFLEWSGCATYDMAVLNIEEV